MEKIFEAKTIVAKIFTNTQVKWFGALVYAVFEFTFDCNTHEALMALLIIIIIDFVTGIIASRYCGQQIKSSKIFRTALKILIYFGSISASFLVEKIIGYNIGVDEILIIFLGITELISILENMGRLGFAVPKKVINMLDDMRDGKHPPVRRGK
jgi:toxin secretion/phage lysis holin